MIFFPGHRETPPPPPSKADHDDDTTDPSAPFYELEAFDSLWQGLRWTQIRTRLPVCAKKLLHSRYMLANLVYLGYAIGILVINNDPSLYGGGGSSSNETVSDLPLDQPVDGSPQVNRLYIGFGVVHIISAFLYLWAWRDRSWLDLVLIPEYLNHCEAGLYLWSAIWYSRQDTLGGYYTIAVHKIEMAAATVELVASFGWIASWYITYTRTLGRGFSLDDPDTIAYLTTTTASVMYFVYNIQINIRPEDYGTNLLYTYADILYFIGACYYLFAVLRDEHCFWFLPLAGQYGVAPGRVQIETTKVLPAYGKPRVLLTDLCRRRHKTSGSAIRFESTDSDSGLTMTQL